MGTRRDSIRPTLLATRDLPEPMSGHRFAGAGGRDLLLIALSGRLWRLRTDTLAFERCAGEVPAPVDSDVRYRASASLDRLFVLGERCWATDVETGRRVDFTDSLEGPVGFPTPDGEGWLSISGVSGDLLIHALDDDRTERVPTRVTVPLANQIRAATASPPTAPMRLALDSPGALVARAWGDGLEVAVGCYGYVIVIRIGRAGDEWTVVEDQSLVFSDFVYDPVELLPTHGVWIAVHGYGAGIAIVETSPPRSLSLPVHQLLEAYGYGSILDATAGRTSVCVETREGGLWWRPWEDAQRASWLPDEVGRVIAVEDRRLISLSTDGATVRQWSVDLRRAARRRS